MAGSIRRAAALVAVVSVLPLTAAAQVRPMATQAPPSRSPTPAPRESVSTWYGELQGLSNHLQRVHDQALLRDPALAQAREQLTTAIQRAMDAADPELPRLAARAQAIQEIAAARRPGDTDRIPALERELAQIQARFVRVRSDVLRQPAIARQAHAYEQRLLQRMIQIEPLTEALVARSGELQRLIRAALPQRRND